MRLLLVEPSDNHHETLLSVIALLKALPEAPTLIVSGPAKFAPLYQSLDEVSGFLPLPDKPEALLHWTAQEGITAIFHNTAYGRYTLHLTKARLPQFGIIHDTEKLHRLSYMGWRIAARLQKFFVLREKLRSSLPSFWRRKAYTLYLHRLPASLWRQLPEISRPAGERWFAIPGRVELKRRAYLDLIAALAEKPPPPEWRFLLLGPADAPHSDWTKISALLHTHKLARHFIAFPEGLDFPTYHAYLRACEAVLPLIHPGMPYFEKYQRYQITGAFSLAFTHRKPLIIHKSFAEEPDISDAAYFYETPTELLSLLDRLPEKPLYQQPLWSATPEGLLTILRK